MEVLKDKDTKHHNTGSIRDVSDVRLPDVDGCVGEDLAIAVPAAERGPAAAGLVVATDVAEDLVALGVSQQIQLQVRVTLAVMWREAEATNAVNFHKVQIKLLRQGNHSSHKSTMKSLLAHLRGSQLIIQPARRTWSSLLVCRRRCLRKWKREHFRTRMRSVVPSAR